MTTAEVKSKKSVTLNQMFAYLASSKSLERIKGILHDEYERLYESVGRDINELYDVYSIFCEENTTTYGSRLFEYSKVVEMSQNIFNRLKNSEPELYNHVVSLLNDKLEKYTISNYQFNSIDELVLELIKYLVDWGSGYNVDEYFSPLMECEDCC